MADLITIDDVRLYDPASIGPNVEEVVGMLISAMSQFVIDYTGRDFAATSYTERNGYLASGDTIIPKHSPLVSVTSLVIDGETVPVSTDDDTPGYRIDGDVLKLLGYSVGKKSKVTLVYTAGVVPTASLKLAVVRLVQLALKERGSIGTQSQSMAGYSVSYLPSIIPATVREVLDQHRVRGF